MIALGVGLAAYPLVSGAVARRHASEVIQSYDEAVQALDGKQLDAARAAARSYNDRLTQTDSPAAEDARAGQVDLLDAGTVLGSISIPKIDVELPIYDSTDADALLKGVGHVEGTSYPVGGADTHCVLTGHRGLAEAGLFTDLDELAVGDYFYLRVMDETLAYRVDQIKIVEPQCIDDLAIVPGGDYCTLVTCTPYAINTHRLLVRGVRVPYTEAEDTAEVSAPPQTPHSDTRAKRAAGILPWCAVALGAVLLLFGLRRKGENQ